MHVLRLTAENFKRLTAIEIVPDPDDPLVMIAGRNGQGKSSVLDAIWAALGGGEAAKHTPLPVRDGAEAARVQLDLGDLLVTRKWKEDGSTTLEVRSQENGVAGSKHSSPQKVLDALVGRISFDPLAFTNLRGREQRDQLLTLIDLPFVPGELAAKREHVYNLRTDINRDLKSYEARLAVLTPPAEDAPTTEVSASAVIAEMDEARKQIAANAAVRKHAESCVGVVADAAGDVAAFERELVLTQTRAAESIKAAEQALADAKQAAADAIEEGVREIGVANERLRAEQDELRKAAADEHSLEPDPDMAALQIRLAGLEETNIAVRAAADYKTMEDCRAALQQQSDRFTKQLEEIDQYKVDSIAAAKMPIEGLAFDDDGLTYDGVPFVQASSAQKLRVSIAMAVALNPEVRVIRITDGSLLDPESMALVREMALEHDQQVWIEVVDVSGEVGIVIEDGSVA